MIDTLLVEVLEKSAVGYYQKGMVILARAHQLEDAAKRAEEAAAAWKIMARELHEEAASCDLMGHFANARARKAELTDYTGEGRSAGDAKEGR